MKVNYRALRLASKICAMTFTLLFGIVTVVGSFLLANASGINAKYGIATEIRQDSGDSADTDSYYYKSAFSSVAGVRANGLAYCEAVVKEGAVLLKNAAVTVGGETKPALPLKENAKVSLFSTSSVSHFTSGSGSSNYVDTGADTVDLKTGLEEAGMKVNGDLWNWYKNNFRTYGRKSRGITVGNYYSIGEASWAEINTSAKTNRDYGDAAIFVLSRSGGEGADLSQWYGNNLVQEIGASADDMTDGDYLKLNKKEIDVLKNLKAEKDKGTFKKIIVLLNAANAVECDFVDKPEYGIDALMWIGMTGASGAKAVGKLLNGKSNPSGRLADTYWKDNTLTPANANFGMNVSANARFSQLSNRDGNVFASDVDNIVYQEGIYIGYRYTETRYEDAVMGAEKVGNFQYRDTVAYPFGYGLSYTSFEYSDFNVRYIENKDGDNIYEATVKVTNRGSVAGKEVVQLYLQKPYTDYDRANGIEKAAVELVGYDKTDMLASGASQTLTIRVNEREFASYDAQKAGTYIVDGGNYYFAVGKNAHDAVNNILAHKGKTTSDGMTANGNAAFSKVFVKNYASDPDNIDKVTYSTAAATGNEIVNRFEKTDLKYYNGAADFDYVTRKDWQGTVKLFGRDGGKVKYNSVKINAIGGGKNSSSTPVSAQMAAERKAALEDPKPDAEKVEYPTYGARHDTSAEGHLSLIDLRAYSDDDDDPTNDDPIPYDSEMWDDLLDQLTWDETVALFSNGFRMTYAIPSISKPQTKDHNGACGPIEVYTGGENNSGFASVRNDPDGHLSPVLYPSNILIASTFNKELAEYYGKQWGEDCLWAGYAGLYGMGINTHRSQYGGRNFEYYSEDPVLGGTQAAFMTKGMATRGVYVYLKHCALNDQESYRCGGYTWANEQTIREIYLKQFQIAIEDGGAQCVMTGLNNFGLEWCGSQGFVKNVLRNEFGMTGHAVSDYWWDVQGNYMAGVMAGHELPDGYFEPDGPEVQFFQKAAPVSEGGTGNYGEFAWAMREGAHRILYTVVHSNAMNGFDSSTRIIKVTPSWMKTITALKTTATVLFIVSMVLLVAAITIEPIVKHIRGKGEKHEKV